MTTPDPARYLRDAIADSDARAIVDAWHRLDTVNRERDALAAELAATRPAPEPTLRVPITPSVQVKRHVRIHAGCRRGGHVGRPEDS
jgi:hypothetical protein